MVNTSLIKMIFLGVKVRGVVVVGRIAAHLFTARRWCLLRSFTSGHQLEDNANANGLTVEKFQHQLLTLAQREQGDREQALLNKLSLWAQQIFS